MVAIVWDLSDPVPFLLRSPEYQRALTCEAWRRWVIASCEEWTSGHVWLLELTHDDEYGPTVDLRCECCPAGVGEVYPDGHDLMSGWLPDLGVTVQHGTHDSPAPLLVPVEVDVWGSKTWTDYGWDYDAGVEIHQRGPARRFSDDIYGDRVKRVRALKEAVDRG